MGEVTRIFTTESAESAETEAEGRGYGIFNTENTEDTETELEGKGFGSGCRASSFSGLSALYVVNIFCAACAGNAGPASIAARGGAVASPPAVVGVPSGPAAEVYATEGIASVLADPFALRLAAEVDASRKQHGQVPVVRDGRLDRVAADIALTTDAVQASRPEAVAFLLAHYGLVEPDPNLFLLRGDDGAEESAVRNLRGQLAKSAASDWRQEGIGVRRAQGRWSAVLVFQEKNFELDPIPRRLASGGHVKIAGRIRPPFQSPEVLFTSPGGKVERLATSATRDSFAARLECNRCDGAYQVEISAMDSRGPRVLANFPVFCGVAPPATYTSAEPAVDRSLDPVAMEAQLLAQLDRDRRAAGLPALVHDPRLAQIARRYSHEMAESGEVAHVSRRTGNVVDRARAAGISPSPTFIAENVGSALSAGDAERGFMGSPGHRDNILNRLGTHVGVGVAVGREAGGTVPLFFTQIFAGWGQ